MKKFCEQDYFFSASSAILITLRMDLKAIKIATKKRPRDAPAAREMALLGFIGFINVVFLDLVTLELF